MELSRDPIDRLSRSKQRFLILLCLLLGLLVLVPILQRFVAMRIFMDIFLTAIFISMVYAISRKKRHILLAVLFASPMLITLWWQYFCPNDAVIAAGKIFGVLFCIMVIVNILGFIFKSEDVALEVIYAAMVVYLTMAFMWTFIYTFLEHIDPASFNVTLAPGQNDHLLFLYYSFVTLTTLGYGDITPATEIAKSFSILEAVVGQLYLVVVVAWLVGMYVSSKSR